MATSYYASSVTEFLEDQNIDLVSKEKNPQYCPQVRSVETFWSILDERIYANRWEVKTIGQVIRRINQTLKQIDMKSVQVMFFFVFFFFFVDQKKKTTTQENC